MSARSFVIQLQPGVGQAILPDHRKMVPGIQYVVDAETFGRISLGARQNVIQVVNVNLDTISGYTTAIASGTFVPAQASSGINNQAAGANTSFLGLLSRVSTTPTTYSLAGFAAQGYDAGGTAGTNTGVGQALSSISGAAANQTLTGPDGARYSYVYNGTGTTISGGWVTVWTDENSRYVGVAASGGSYLVKADGLNTSYVVSATVTGIPATNGTTSSIGTKQGGFAGITLVDLPAGNFGWVQIEGYCPRVALPSGTAIGAAVAVSGSSSAGLATLPASTTAATSSGGVVTGTALANNLFGTVLTTPVSGTGTGQYFSAVEIRSRRGKKPYNRFLNKN